MDCEGSEYPILESLEEHDLLKRFSVIMLEYHYKGSDVIKERLKRANFAFFESVINDIFGLIYAIRIS